LSLAAPSKFIGRLEEAGIECPEVLSIAQVFRVLAIFALLGLAVAIMSLPAVLGT
jgi:hypothetical protein